jgi:hypothetical protein
MGRLTREFWLEPEDVDVAYGGALCTVLKYLDNHVIVEFDGVIVINNRPWSTLLLGTSSADTNIQDMKTGVLGVRLYTSWSKVRGQLIKSTPLCRGVIYPEGAPIA